VIYSMAGPIRASELGLHAEGKATLPAPCTDLCDLPWRHPGTRSSGSQGATPRRARSRAVLPRGVPVATARSVRCRALLMQGPARPIGSGARQWRIGGGGGR
jgi:hypothetical protein